MNLDKNGKTGVLFFQLFILRVILCLMKIHFPHIADMKSKGWGWASKQMLGNHGAECKSVDLLLIKKYFLLDCTLSWQHWSPCPKSKVFALRRWTRIFQPKDNKADICSVFPKQVKSKDWFSQYSVSGLLIIITESSKIQGSCLWPLLISNAIN